MRNESAFRNQQNKLIAIDLPPLSYGLLVFLDPSFSPIDGPLLGCQIYWEGTFDPALVADATARYGTPERLDTGGHLWRQDAPYMQLELTDGIGSVLVDWHREAP